MKKIKKFIKCNIKVVIAFVLGLVIAGSIRAYAANILNSREVSYSNNNSGLSKTNVQEAIDELASKTELKNRPNIIEAYTYNSSTCVTGEEDTCKKTDCYKSKTANSCKVGDIIKYKVNDTDIVTFHVMYDNGSTMTMLLQKSIIRNTPWITAADYATENTDNTSCGYTSCNDEGPMTVLVALERATSSWTNVNNQTYTMGTTTFKTNALTGCSSYNSCATNTYTLPSRTVKARMISLQEVTNLGCTSSAKSCPKWMNNYLYNSTSNGGTVSDDSTDTTTGRYNTGYWTMSVSSTYTYAAWRVHYDGSVGILGVNDISSGARAVIVINK